MSVEPYDEALILNEDSIIRRVNPNQHVVPDGNGGKRISSKLFTASSGTNGGMSVDILKLIEDAGVNAQQFVQTPEYTGAVVFPASAARDAKLIIGFDPIIDDAAFPENPYHGQVWSIGDEGKTRNLTGSQKRALTKSSQWFVELEGVDIC